MKLHQKTIVITGGTSGIGYEIVRQLHESNTLIVIARNAEKLSHLKKTFPAIQTCPADLSKRTDIEAAANNILKQHKAIDVLINNAAVQYTPTFLSDDFSYESIAQEITLNFTAVCSLCYLLLPALRHEKPAAIVNVSSGLALMPKTTSAVYCATKGAINIFSQSLRYQLEDTNINVLQAILPLVDTPMTEGRGAGKITAEKAAKQIIHGIKHNIEDHDIGKVKLLRLLMRLAPNVARNIMKKN